MSTYLEKLFCYSLLHKKKQRSILVFMYFEEYLRATFQHGNSH